MKIKISYNEIWKPVYINNKKTRYLVSNLGRVVNSETGNLFKPQKDKKGYLRITLRLDGKAYTKKVHRLVAEAFLKKPLIKKQVNHKDGKKQNNKEWNLEWINNSNNQLHAYRMGLRIPKTGINHHNNKYPEELIISICECLAKGYSTKDIKKHLNISSKDIKISYLINDIKKKGKWKHISKRYNL